MLGERQKDRIHMDDWLIRPGRLSEIGPFQRHPPAFPKGNVNGPCPARKTIRLPPLGGRKAARRIRIDVSICSREKAARLAARMRKGSLCFDLRPVSWGPGCGDSLLAGPYHSPLKADRVPAEHV